MFEGPPITKILYCYSVYHDLFDEMGSALPLIQFKQGLPSKDELDSLSADKQPSLLILDDLMELVGSSQNMSDLFCQYTHHKNINVIYISQNLFQQGKYARTIALNTSVLVLMKSMRNSSQIKCLASQIYPGETKRFMEAYKDATSQPFGYLTVDMAPSADDNHRLRTHIFPDQDTVVYLPVTK